MPQGSKVVPASEAVKMVVDGDIVAVNSSSGLCCPDAVLAALGERFDTEGSPRDITSVHPIAAGDMFGTTGTDHIAKPGLLACIIGGSYISGPSSMEPPKIWQMIGKNEVKAYNLPSGVIFDMLREGAAQHPGVLTKVGMETFVDPALEGGAMNAAARIEPIVEQKEIIEPPAYAPQGQSQSDLYALRRYASPPHHSVPAARKPHPRRPSISQRLHRHLDAYRKCLSCSPAPLIPQKAVHRRIPLDGFGNHPRQMLLSAHLFWIPVASVHEAGGRPRCDVDG